MRGVESEGLNDTTWGAVGKLVGVADMGPTCLGARMIALAYGFMVLIMVRRRRGGEGSCQEAG